MQRHLPILNWKRFLGEVVLICGLALLNLAIAAYIVTAFNPYGSPQLHLSTIASITLLITLLLILDHAYRRFELRHAVFVLRATIAICILFFAIIVTREDDTFQNYCVYVPTISGFLGAPVSGMIAVAELVQFLIRGLKHGNKSVLDERTIAVSELNTENCLHAGDEASPESGSFEASVSASGDSSIFTKR